MKSIYKLILLGMMSSGACGQTTMFVESPEGWSIVSQNPCDSFIVFQNNQIRDSNFIYYLVIEHETVALSDISDIIVDKFKCTSPDTKKTGIGAIQVTCANDISINVWESNASYHGQDIPIYSSIILKNMKKELVMQELPKLVQTSMQYQDNAIHTNLNGFCYDDIPEESKNKPIALPHKY